MIGIDANEIQYVGVDVGFGDVEAAMIRDGKLVTTQFPAVLGHAQQLSRANTGLGAVTRRRAKRMVYNNVEYFVGEDALLHSVTQAARQDRNRIGSEEERILALTALARLGVSDAVIVTGLPVMWFDDRKKLVKSWRGEHTFIWGKQTHTIRIHQVLAAYQPFGGFYVWALDQQGRSNIPEEELMRTYGFFDIGWNTTDLSAIRQMQPVDTWSAGFRVGVRNVVDIVSDEINRRGLSLTAHEVNQAIKERRIEVYGQYHDIGQVIDSAVASLAQQAVSVATDRWGNGERLSQILIFGGGAALLGKAIQQAFPRNSTILPSPWLANATGFCHFAQRAAQKSK